MKTVNQNTINAQKSNNPFILENVILYQLFDEHRIKEYVGASEVVFDGDISQYLNTGDEICFPLSDFTVDVTITSISYDGGNDETDVYVSSPIFSADWVGSYAAKKYNITDKLLKKSIKDVVQKIEGVELNNFDSGKLDFDVDNSDGYFSNKNKTGLIDSERIFFVKYLIKFKASQDSDLIYFGGILSLIDSQPDYYNKSYSIRVLGHSKELERYAAYNVSNYNEITFTKIAGVEVIEYESSDDSQEGIKDVRYEPFSNSRLKGITVEKVSPDTSPGIKILEFRWPYYFRWDNGAWYKIGAIGDTSSGKKKMYAKDGSSDSKYAIVVFGDSDTLNEYPDEDTEDWVDVKNSDTQLVGQEVTQQGAPIFSFDGGQPISMKIHFQRVLVYDDSAGTYTEISDITNTPVLIAKESSVIMDDTDDELIIIASERFWGIEFFLNDLFSAGALEVYYSQGGSVWSNAIDLVNNGFVDGTAGFTQSGKIRWNDLPNWAINDIVVSTSVDYKGFMIKIKMTSQTGTLSVYEIKRIIKAQGSTGDFLTIQFNQLSLSKESITDSVIITKDINGVWQISFWFNNVPVPYLLNKCLDESFYLDTNRNITPLKIIKTEPRFNIWGKSPKYSYSKIMRTFDIEYFDEDNFTIWALIDNEIWKCTNQGIWEIVYEIKMPEITYFGLDLLPEYRWYAKKIFKVGDVLYCLFHYLNLTEIGQMYYYCKYDTSTNTFTSLYQTDRYETHDCEAYARVGYGFDSGGFYRRYVGNYLGTHYGENVPIPFRQIVNVKFVSMNPTVVPSQNLEDNWSDSFPEWYFDSDWGGFGDDNSGRFFSLKMGYFHVDYRYDQHAVNPVFGFKFSFGQRGVIIIEKSNGNLWMFIRGDAFGEDYKWVLTNMNTGAESRHLSYDFAQLPSSSYYDETNDELFLCYTAFHDTNSPYIRAQSYITKTLLAESPVRVWARAYHYDSGTVTTTEVTTEANAGTLFGSGYTYSANNDAFYLGSDYRFNKVYVALLTPTSSDFVVEYWDGSSWTAVRDNYDSEFTDPFMLVIEVPPDWAKTIVGSSQDLYYLRIRQTSGLGTAIVGFELVEIVLWHSYDDTDFETYSPINIASHPSDDGYLYGVAFNRNATGDNAFQWILFALDKEGGQIGTGLHFITDTNAIGFTIDNTQLYKDLVYNPIDGHCYLIAENTRFKDRSAYLLKMKVNESTEQLDVTFCGIPVSGEWGNLDNNNLLCEDNSGSIFGLTNGTKYKFWEYSKEYYQRIEVADLKSFNSIRDVIREIALITNCLYFIKSERVIVFIKRDEYGESIDLTWDENVLTEKPDFTRWEHYFDAVIVNFNNLFDNDDKGNKKLGYDSWLKKVMNIQSALIQDEHIALVVCENLYDFYNNYRVNVKSLKTIPLIQVELTDKFNLYMPDDIIEIDSTTDFIIIGISKKSDFNLNVEGLEKIAPESGAS